MQLKCISATALSVQLGNHDAGSPSRCCHAVGILVDAADMLMHIHSSLLCGPGCGA
jgi:hypothetical protein